jgi:hypothetical protein
LFTQESVAADAVRTANVTFFDAVLAGLTSVCGSGAAIVVVNALESVAADAAGPTIAPFFNTGTGLASICGHNAAIPVVNALESVAADAAHIAIATFFQAGLELTVSVLFKLK